MNFYTSNFKRKKTIIFFAIVIVAIISSDYIIHHYVANRTSSKFFIEDKQSKIKHMTLNYLQHPDIVLIGSSRTIFHISTDILRQHGIKAYNLGISGIDLSDYPSLVESALGLGFKTFVLNISGGQLVSEDAFSFKKSTFVDTYYLMQAGFGFQNILLSFFYATANFHSLYKYSEPIYLRISQYLKQKITWIDETTNLEPHDVHQSKKEDIVDHCIPFSREHSAKDKLVMKCTNGDGVLFGRFEKSVTFGNIDVPSLNPNVVNILNLIVEEIKKQKSNVIIVLEPSLEVKYLNLARKVREAIPGVALIDLSLQNFSIENWIDTAHLNHSGRSQYSYLLSEKLRTIGYSAINL